MSKVEQDVQMTKEEVKIQIKILQRDIQNLKNNLRFGINIVSKNLNKAEVRPYKKVYKALKNSKQSYSLTEFESLINEIQDVIQTTIVVPFAIEDNSSGDLYYFDTLVLEPQYVTRITDYIKEEINQFELIRDPGKVFVDINRQFSSEIEILSKTQELLTLQGK